MTTVGALASIESLLNGRRPLPCALKIHKGNDVAVFGKGVPRFEVYVRNERGMRALRSLHELEIIEAYMMGDLDVDGDFVAAMSFKGFLSDSAPWLKAWRRLKPVLIGRRRCNPTWIAKHYDSNNLQLLATDSAYDTYTPGIYESADDTLEEGARRKLGSAFEALQLQSGQTLLDVGCGWGGFMRYSAERGVRPTGITLSRDQFDYTRQKLREEGLHGEAFYQDFFSYEPEKRFDAISMMGVMEDLSDYGAVISRVSRWLRPRGRIYLDFATERKPFSTASFITKYIWPGTFRKVYLPELIQSIWASPFEIVSLYNDRLNYHLWGKKVHERWVERKAEAREQMGEEGWRMFRVLFAAAESIMSDPSHLASAQRMVLERTPDA